ncbi:hypothetical protein QJS04_geneDACA019186 [Acorus gramineus]|uniref:ARC6 IMS domain-containing protein n=1 Tax=Acorus gramineus TaxID=55184 RepID=A0AAV9BA65_ACOGR|nr:hypothetical protein QJS04_geneDACA019186 [Acorus gramineus]
MELKNAEIDDGYTTDVIASRQNLLMDVRDKLLFEQEYAGNLKERIPPKSSLRLPWAWLPGALCLLQEVGEDKTVLEIGRAALQHPDSKPYVHDVLLSMALAECSIAKTTFEKNKVSQGFEALARAQHILKNRSSLLTLPLLSQIEESLEELAPACTLEMLSLPLTPDNAERRRGAVAALCELLRQGLEVETVCKVQDWPSFLNHALNKLLAVEIIDLLSWGALAITRKNKKSLESQNQRVVIDFNCFYLVMLAHIALGFSRRQIDLINIAKSICECLIASDGIDLKFEEAFCSFLLGQGDEKVAADRLQHLEIGGHPASRSLQLKHKASQDPSLEKWLKDVVLCAFADTRDCSPSFANFFGGPKRVTNRIKQCKGSAQTISNMSQRLPAIIRPLGDCSFENSPSTVNSTKLPGDAVKQLTPSNLQSHLAQGQTGVCNNVASVQLKRNLGMHHRKIRDIWWATRDMLVRLTCVSLLGCIVFVASKLPVMFKKQVKRLPDVAITQKLWPFSNLSSLSISSAGAGNVLYKRQMPLDEAEALVRQWQTIKAEALGPNHEIESLSDVLRDSMLHQWQDLADSAKARSCFWRFVLLRLSVLRAEIMSDGNGGEMAEIEAVLEEAAELIDKNQQNNPNYYSTYKIQYVLKRQYDGSWRFCQGSVQSPG